MKISRLLGGDTQWNSADATIREVWAQDRIISEPPFRTLTGYEIRFTKTFDVILTPEEFAKVIEP